MVVQIHQGHASPPLLERYIWMKRAISVALTGLLLTLGFGLSVQPAAASTQSSSNTIVTPDGHVVTKLPALAGVKPDKTKHVFKGLPSKPGTVTTLTAGVCDGVTGNACFNYNIGSQGSISKNGITGVNRVGGSTGALQADGYHTLGETAVQSSDQHQIIEAGWTVDPTINKTSGVGVTTPRPFVFYWVNGVPQVYNGGAFVPVSGATVVPGVTDLVPGAIPKFVIWHDDTQHVWWISWNGVYMGYYADATWTGATPSVSFTRIQFVQNFGEVASTVSKPCTDMGLGVANDTTNSARFSSISYIGPVYSDPLDTASVNMTLSSTTNASSPEAGTYGAGSPPSTTNLRSFYYGGPMWNSAKTGVGTAGAC